MNDGSRRAEAVFYFHRDGGGWMQQRQRSDPSERYVNARVSGGGRAGEKGGCWHPSVNRLLTHHPSTHPWRQVRL